MTDRQPITVRPATADDAERIAALFTDEGYPAGPSDIVERLGRFDSPHSRVLVADHDGEILGFVAIHALPRFEHSDRILRIMALVVDAGVRERGIGRLLMEEAERHRPGARRGVRRGDRRSPPARCPPAVRGARLRRHRRRLPPQAALSRLGRPATVASPEPDPVGSAFPRLRLRDPAIDLVDLPWELPLAEWPSDGSRSATSRSARRAISSGSSSSSGVLYALKELPLGVGRQRVRGPAPPREPPACRRSRPAGVAEAPAARPGDPRHEVPAALAPVPAADDAAAARRAVTYRDRLLDAMAFLLVDLHRTGVFWGDCSLANTLFRRDGDRIQAYLVDAETSEVLRRCRTASGRTTSRSSSRTSPSGSPTCRRCRAGTRTRDEAIARRRARPRPLPSRSGRLIHDEPVLHPDDRQAIRNRVRKLNDLGYSVDLDVDPDAADGRRPAADERHDPPLPRPRARAADADPGARGPGPAAPQRPQRVRGLAASGARPAGDRPSEAAERWLREVYRPTLARIAAAVGPDRDLVQAYCDVLEEKWFLSEQDGPGRRARGRDRRLPRPRGARRPRPAAATTRRTSSTRSTLDLVELGSSADDPPSRRSMADGPSATSLPKTWHHRTMSDRAGRRRGARHPRRRPAQDVRRDARRRRGQLRGPAGRRLRAARAERRGQDDDRRGPRGPARARLAARSACSASTRPQPRRAPARGSASRSRPPRSTRS